MPESLADRVVDQGATQTPAPVRSQRPNRLESADPFMLEYPKPGQDAAVLTVAEPIPAHPDAIGHLTTGSNECSDFIPAREPRLFGGFFNPELDDVLIVFL